MAYAVIDGSSLKLADPRGRKNFGRLGNGRSHSRGLKVITAYGMEAGGVPLGIPLAQTYWARLPRVRRGPKSADNRRRSPQDKETRYWLDVIRQTSSYADQSKLWFIIDREGDSRSLLLALSELTSRFTVRSSWSRLLALSLNGKRTYLRPMMASAPILAHYQVDVPAGHKRQARTARMQLRSARAPLVLKDRWRGSTLVLEVNVVWAVEVGTTPKGEKPLDWMLLTNAPVATEEEAFAVIRSYQMRWRIEEFHKTWKSDHCNVEDTQLHTMHAATIFAAMHAAVAARAERLKQFARTAPDEPASVELTAAERKAVAAFAYEIVNYPLAPGGRRQHKMVVPDPETMTIGIAVEWIARRGGYTGKSSGGPPGAGVIARGLEDIIAGAQVITALADMEK
jgi:hypothetical protein